jgi:hypothetical protein
LARNPDSPGSLASIRFEQAQATAISGHGTSAKGLFLLDLQLGSLVSRFQVSLLDQDSRLILNGFEQEHDAFSILEFPFENTRHPLKQTFLDHNPVASVFRPF